MELLYKVANGYKKNQLHQRLTFVTVSAKTSLVRTKI